jgi:universal stress protein A
MLTIKKILCPVDFSEPSVYGLGYAVDLAALFQAELEVLYVLPVVPPRTGDMDYHFQIPEYEGILHHEAEEQLTALIKAKVPATIKTKVLIGHGNAGKEIVRLAGEGKADLIVIATHGHGGWHHLVLGSVAEKVVRHAPCPVFAVREPH